METNLLSMDAKTGKTTAETIDLPVLTVEEGQAVQAAEEQLAATGRTLEDRAFAALDSLRAYRDLQSPTNAQTVQAVKLLCRVCIGLIRLHLRRFDGAD